MRMLIFHSYVNVYQRVYPSDYPSIIQVIIPFSSQEKQVQLMVSVPEGMTMYDISSNIYIIYISLPWGSLTY